MSDSGCLDVIENKTDGIPFRCSLYESIFLDDEFLDDDTADIMDKVDDAQKKKEEVERFNQYIADNFIVTPEVISKTTQVEHPEPDKKFVKEVKLSGSFIIKDDYQNPSPNASPIHSCKEIITEPVVFNWSAWTKDMVCLASEKFAPVGDYLHGLNKDITTKY